MTNTSIVLGALIILGALMAMAVSCVSQIETIVSILCIRLFN